jgi:hypothetical protein
VCGQNVQLLNVKLLVRHVTSRFLKVNTGKKSCCVWLDLL